jgi:predicted Zn-dependent protease
MDREGSLALLGLAALLAAGCETMGAIGESISVSGFPGSQYVGMGFRAAGAVGKVAASYKDLDEPQEIELGRAVTASIGGQYRLYRNVPLTHYVALTGNAVAVQSDRPDIRYVFAVLDTLEVNAFAAPGGYIFVTRGALAMMRDEAVLAGVLAHEVGHVALRHHAESIKQEKRTEGFKEGAFLGADYAVSRAGGSGGATARMLFPAFNGIADVVVQGILKGHSREEEMEADKVGFVYAQRAGYDPAGLKEFLAAMVSRGAAGTTATFFSTHPAMPERITEQDKLLKDSRPGVRNTERFRRALAGARIS